MGKLGPPGMPQRYGHYSDLAPGQQELVRTLQKVGFGKMKDLHIRRGVPVFEPKPRIIRAVKLGARAVEYPAGDFILKRKVVDMLEHFHGLEATVVRCIEVQYGLPFRIFMELESA